MPPANTGERRCIMDFDEDVELMLRIRQGDTTAFAELYRNYLPLATAFAVAFGGRGVSAPDIAQEAFLRLWDRRQAYRGEAGVRTYILAYVRNVCLEERRLRRRAQALFRRVSSASLAQAVTASTPETPAYASEMSDLLERGFGRLSEPQRQALRLYHVEGMSLREGALFAGCTQKCFESRLSRGRARLRCFLLHPDRFRKDG